MDVMLHVSSADAAPTVLSLARACARAGIKWGCFFTNDGVRALTDSAIVDVLAGAERAAVCEHSWQQVMGDGVPPIEAGSQTVNSAMMAEAERVVSL